MTLPSYVDGSNDTRTYIVRGVIVSVSRGVGVRRVGFSGGGRDGDYVPEGAREPDVIRAMTEGVAGMSASGPTEWDVDSESALATIEARMAEAAGGPFTISRDSHQSMEVARALLDAPVPDGMFRTWSLRGAWSLTVAETRDRSAIATPWAWGRDPGDWLATTLAATGVAEVVTSGAGNAATRAVPRAQVRALLERALANPLLGEKLFQLTDTRTPR